MTGQFTAVRVGDIDTIPEIDPYHRGTGTQTKTAFIINPDRRIVGVEQWQDIGATPIEYANGYLYKIVVDWHPGDDYAEELLSRADVQTLLARICDGWDGWDGSGEYTRARGELSDDGDEAMAALTALIQDQIGSGDDWSLWTAEEWANAQDCIGVDTTDEQIDEIVAEALDEAESNRYHVQGDLRGVYVAYRAELIAEAAEAAEMELA